MGSVGSKSRKVPKPLINWFEIPVLNMERAISFYNTLYGINLQQMKVNDYHMAVFPVTTGMGGALLMGQGCIPSETGVLIYLNATLDLDVMLQRIEDGGGRVIMEKTLINEESGYFALFIDTEGNKLALNSKP